MSQDIVADIMNQVMNAKRAGKSSVKVNMHSNLLLSVLAVGRLKGYIEDYEVKGNELEIKIGSKLNACRAIKPRYVVRVRDLDKYVRRYLPARGVGMIIVSTSEGLMTHQTAMEKKKGGSLIAYFY